jgi:phage shock protein PspC (stress-responsive transcriptional regulator)
MIGGVAAGLARHLEVDVVWVRLAFVVTAIFANGLGLVAYIAAWIIIPAGDDRDAGSSSGPGAPSGPAATGSAPDGVRGARFWVGVGLVGLGSLVLLDRLLSPLQARLGWISPSQLLVPLAIIGVGVVLWRSSRADTGFDSATIERGAERFAERVEQEAEAAAERLERWVDDGGALPEPGAPGTPRAPRTEPGGPDAASVPSRITPATLGIALVAAGTVWLLSGLGVSGATFTRALAAALLVVGGGLVVSAFLGRGRGLIGTGLLLAPVVLLATLAEPSAVGMRAIGVADGVVVLDPDAVVEERPTDLATLQDSYAFGVGSVVLDLSTLDAAELAAAGTTRVSVELGIGDLLVVLSDGVTVVTTVELGIGQVDLAGRTSGGLGVSATRTLVGTTEDAGTIVLEIEQGIGRVRVTR